MPDGYRLRRSRRYEDSASQASSIDVWTDSCGSPSPGEPTRTRTRIGAQPVETRIVTTHVDAAATGSSIVPPRSTKRLVGVRHGVHDDDAPSIADGSRLIRLLNGFEVRIGGRTVDFAPNTQRLLAFLGLHERPQPRRSVAGSLWIDHSERRAAANLRTALWKLGAPGRQLVASRAGQLSLAEDVTVDFRDVVCQARQLLHNTTGREVVRATDDTIVNIDVFAGDLLPDWDEDWILFERERLRQLRMHAIETVSRQLALAGRYAEAVDAGLAAVAADSLRESAHRVLIEAYLAEDNVAEARRQFERFRGLLWDSLHLIPSTDLAALVGA